VDVQSGSGVTATATICLKSQLATNDETLSTTEAAIGNGPVDAVYKCLSRISGFDIDIADYHITAKGEGKDALGQVDIVATYEGRKFHGIGLATDIIESSALAYIHVMNNIYRANAVEQQKLKKQNQ